MDNNQALAIINELKAIRQSQQQQAQALKKIADALELIAVIKQGE